MRLRSRVKAYPLEKIRLATADELLSADYILAALKDMEGELQGGRLQVQDYKPEKETEQEADEEKESDHISAGRGEGGATHSAFPEEATAV